MIFAASLSRRATKTRKNITTKNLRTAIVKIATARASSMESEGRMGGGMNMEWKSIDTAPKDGTWVLGINSRQNCAVIIWSVGMNAFGEMRDGWIHPFTDGRLSSFWNGGCGSVPTHWMHLPAPPPPAPEPTGERE